ncbi:hypothetical protein N665_0194s0021 [Sinapis alba]|nr:hypothetical protein N665_0194s0021 [Sinapis alba]
MADMVREEFMLDLKYYGNWKVKMKAILLSIDVDVWAALEDGYEVLKAVEKNGVVVIKPISKWEKREKEMSRYNTKSLSSIFTSIKKKQLNMIQGCTNAKEAWDILQTHFEGTKKMELDGVNNHTEVKVATAETTNQKPESEDKVIQIICVLQQVLQDVICVSSQGEEAGEPCINIESQCKGIGHTQCECEHDEKKKKERSLLHMSDNGSEKEEVLNLIALSALKDESHTSANTYYDT